MIIHPSLLHTQMSGIRMMAQRAAEKKHPVYALTLGLPHIPTPEHIVRAARDAAQAGHTVYTPNAGLPALREAIADYMHKKYGLHYDGLSEVLVTHGATHAIDAALRTILTPGCDVLLPSPAYPGYEPLIRLCGARPIAIDTSASDFRLTPDVLAQHITPHTRCLILTSPSNPCGTAYDQDTVRRIAHVLADHDMMVLSDEIYSELVYDRAHTSIASIPEMRPRTIVVNGLSKSHAMTGWRIGWIAAPASIAQHITKVIQYSITCACSISQHAAYAAVTTGTDDALALRTLYAAHRDITCTALRSIGCNVVRPDGAFYVFPNIRHFGLDSMTFATQLLDAQHVAIVPGSAFGPHGEGYVRISYACATADLHEALARLCAWARTL
jgi:aminotransferase